MDYQWNEHCVCTNPTVEHVGIKDNYRVKVSYAERDGIWYGATDIRHGAEGQSYPVSYMLKHFSSESKNLLRLDLWIDARDTLQHMANHPEKGSINHWKMVEKLLWRVKTNVRIFQAGQRDLFEERGNQ